MLEVLLRVERPGDRDAVRGLNERAFGGREEADLVEVLHRQQAAVVALGHAEYYPRFGFVPAHQFGLRCEYDVPADVFMAMELERGSLDLVSGLVRYHSAFAGV